MRLKLIPCMLAAALLWSPANAHARGAGDAVPGEADAKQLDDARRIVQALFPEADRTASLQQVMKVIGQQMAQAKMFDSGDSGMNELFNQFMADLPERLQPVMSRFGEDMAHAMAQAYSREFSASELNEIRKFAETPAGKHYLGASLKMVEDPAIAAANQRFLQTFEREMGPISEEWDRRIANYRARNQSDGREPAPMLVDIPMPPARPVIPAPPVPPKPPG